MADAHLVGQGWQRGAHEAGCVHALGIPGWHAQGLVDPRIIFVLCLKYNHPGRFARKGSLGSAAFDFQTNSVLGSLQEGKFRYVGSGRPHLHVLIFSDELDRAKLEEFVSAAAPVEPVLRGKVACSQRDREEDSKWPIYDGKEGVGWQDDTLKLKHIQADEDAGVHRA